MEQSVTGARLPLKHFAARGLAIVSRPERLKRKKSPYAVR